MRYQAKVGRRKFNAARPCATDGVRFHYPLPALVGKRVTELYSKGADVLTDDFAPADLYRMTPIGVPKRQ